MPQPPLVPVCLRIPHEQWPTNLVGIDIYLLRPYFFETPTLEARPASPILYYRIRKVRNREELFESTFCTLLPPGALVTLCPYGLMKTDMRVRIVEACAVFIVEPSSAGRKWEKYVVANTRRIGGKTTVYVSNARLVADLDLAKKHWNEVKKWLRKNGRRVPRAAKDKIYAYVEWLLATGALNLPSVPTTNIRETASYIAEKARELANTPSLEIDVPPRLAEPFIFYELVGRIYAPTKYYMFNWKNLAEVFPEYLQTEFLHALQNLLGNERVIASTICRMLGGTPLTTRKKIWCLPPEVNINTIASDLNTLKQARDVLKDLVNLLAKSREKRVKIPQNIREKLASLVGVRTFERAEELLAEYLYQLNRGSKETIMHVYSVIGGDLQLAHEIRRILEGLLADTPKAFELKEMYVSDNARQCVDRAIEELAVQGHIWVRGDKLYVDNVAAKRLRECGAVLVIGEGRANARKVGAR